MDFAVFNFLHHLTDRSAVLDFFVVLFARFVPYFLVLAALFFLARIITGSFKDKVYVFIFMVFSLVLSRGLVVPIIRFFYHRPRPFLALEFTPLFLSEGFSFPSGHAAFFFALAFVIFSFNKRWGWWFFGLALINGVARVAAGVHWPSDILGGIGAAALSFFLVGLVLKQTHGKIEKPE